MVETIMFHEGNRDLQDAFDSRRIADRLEEKLTRTAFTDGDKAFISGADISQFEKLRGTVEAQIVYNKAVEDAYTAPMNTTKPVIARIKGICIGGGLGFAAACDLRICSDDSIFRMPAARLGLGYSPAGVRRFINVLGAANTMEIFFTAKKFDAKEALRMGFVSRVVPVAELEKARAGIGFREVKTDTNVAKISVIGVGMRSHAGVALTMFETLARKGINIEVISTSEIKISVLIEAEYTELAVRALHTAYGLDAA